MPRGFKHSEELKSEIVAKYMELGEAQKVAKLLGVTKDSVKKYVIEAGLPTNDRRYSRSCRQDIPFTSEVFDYSDSELGYICGLVSADGCLMGNSTISLQLQEDDRTSVEWLAEKSTGNKKAVTYEAPRSIKHKALIRFRRRLPKLYQYCLDMGITPRKSLTLDVNLDNKSDEFKWYFLRGAIDGDGCVYVGKRVCESSIRLCSASDVYLLHLQTIFGGTLSRSQSTYMLQFKGAQAIQLSKFLPVDSYHMSRKTNKIKEIAGQKVKAVRRSSILIGSIWGVEEKPLCIETEWRLRNIKIPLSTVKWRMRVKGLTFEQAINY